MMFYHARRVCHRGSRWLKSGEQGVTVFELVIGVALFSIMSGFAAIGYQESQDSFSRKSAKSQLEQDLRRARAIALTEGARVVFSFDADGSGYTVGADYFPFSELLEADFEEFSRVLPDGATVTSFQDFVFDSRGVLADEDGEPMTATFQVNYEGELADMFTVYATGAIESY